MVDRAHGSELDPLPGVRRPGPGSRRARADPAVDSDGGLGPVDTGILDGDLGGEADPLARLLARLQGAVLDAVEGLHQQAGAALGQPVQQVPAVSSGRIVCVITPNVGPASSSGTIRNVVAPVTSSPAQIACCTGAAPRQEGSSEKCRFTQPCAGMSRADCGSNAP